MAVYNKLQSFEEELPVAPKSFVDYVMTLPLMSQYLLYHVRFVPGGKHALHACLSENQKIHIASDGSFDPDAELASHGWHLI